MGHFSPSIPISRDELGWKGIWDINRLTGMFGILIGLVVLTILVIANIYILID
jgi:hypothetical protein